jgi:hypothetical protein
VFRPTALAPHGSFDVVEPLLRDFWLVCSGAHGRDRRRSLPRRPMVGAALALALLGTGIEGSGRAADVQGRASADVLKAPWPMQWLVRLSHWRC